MSTRRSWCVGVLTALLALNLACGAQTAPAKPTGGAAGAPAQPASGAAGAPAASGAAQGPIKIGVLQPLTGPFAVQGKDNQDGFELYLDSINRTVAGRRIEVVVADAQGRPDVGLTKAKQLVENDRVHLLAGITNTAVCYAVAP